METLTKSTPLPPEQIDPRRPVSWDAARTLSARRAFRVLGALIFASACCLAMAGLRRYYVGNWSHLFIAWNLLLAWIPLPFSVAAYRMHTGRTRRYLLFTICALTWFVFFPNAPYITTDFVHLHQEDEVLTWIDLISIASFAWVGLSLGFCSLYLMQEVVRHRAGRVTGWLFVLAMFAAASLGTYVGRFLRWNSWDVLHHPFLLVSDLSAHMSPSYVTTQIYLGLMFLFLLLSYCVLFALMHLHERGEG